MKHFTTEKWIDFTNQAVAVNEKALMEKHLEQGCKRCMETVSLWQKVRHSTAAEGNYQPPADSVRLAKAVFVGARSAGAVTRQMLYRADPFQIDVHLEAKPGSNRIMVTGQLLDLSNPEIVARDTRIFLSNMRGQVVHAVANQFGEFSGEIDNSGDLQLTFASPGATPIVISLREALGHLPEAIA